MKKSIEDKKVQKEFIEEVIEKQCQEVGHQWAYNDMDCLHFCVRCGEIQL